MRETISFILSKIECSMRETLKRKNPIGDYSHHVTGLCTQDGHTQPVHVIITRGRTDQDAKI